MRTLKALNTDHNLIKQCYVLFYCAVLHCFVLCGIKMCCAVLCFSLLCSVTLCFVVWYCSTVLGCAAVCCAGMCYVVLYSAGMFYVAVPCLVGGQVGMLVQWRVRGRGREEGDLFTWSKVEYLDLSVMTSSR